MMKGAAHVCLWRPKDLLILAVPILRPMFVSGCSPDDARVLIDPEVSCHIYPSRHFAVDAVLAVMLPRSCAVAAGDMGGH
eukprot:1473750-Pleurochrysis_carterae.AAC.1